MNNIKLSERLANIWAKSRKDAGKSQDYLAKCLGISKKTVQNYESGYASPNFRTAVEWFEALGLPLYPYLMEALYPNELYGVAPSSDLADLRQALHKHVDELDELHVRELLYILHGNHGSSPTGTLDILTAYLHLPLLNRVCITEDILNRYEILEELNLIQQPEHVKPAKATLKKYAAAAKNAVITGKQSYVIIEENEQ